MKITKEIKNDIKEISSTLGEKDKVIMDLDLYVRMVTRLNAFSSKCEQCVEYLDSTHHHFREILENDGVMDKSSRNNHKGLREGIVKHLGKRHGLYRTGHFMSIYLPLGIAVGIVAGLLFDKPLSYLIVGAAAGYVVGLINENFTKKKGRRI